VSATTPLLEVKGVNKSFGPVHVLHNVDLAVYPGQVTALIGDNGAGKSTLVKTITGIYPRDSGEFLFDGEHVEIAGPKDAADLGIEVVYQDLALCENLDIVQNMFLGRERLKVRLLDERSMEQAARDTLAGLGVRTVKKLAPALQDLIAGRVRMMFDIVPFALQHIRDGSVRGLAVAAIPSAGRW
jgi:D-xylose transport system ATP-binding protein